MNYKFKAEFNVNGSYGTRIAMADTIEDLIDKMEKCGFDRRRINQANLIKFKNSNQYRMYGLGYTLQRGVTRMTEYTSY